MKNLGKRWLGLTILFLSVSGFAQESPPALPGDVFSFQPGFDTGWGAAPLTHTRGLDLSMSLGGAGGIGGMLARTDTRGSTFYHADGNGNITALMDGNQNIVARYEYDGFGRLINKQGSLADANRYRFSSTEYVSQGGIYYYGHRFYEPNFQRWLNRDPIGELGGVNLYRFVGNNPLRFVDPFGLQGGEAEPEEDLDVEEQLPLFRYYPRGTMPEKEWEREYDYLRNHPLGETELRSWNPEEEETTWDKVVDFFSRKASQGRINQGIGQSGENATCPVKNTTHIESLNKTASFRVPDLLDRDLKLIGDRKTSNTFT